MPANGVGVVLLKRLEDALADGDRIRAVIRGAALNNDGAAKVGYTAPGVDGQAEAIALLAVAGLRPGDITYVEAQGTAPPLGDPIEVRALHRAFREGSREDSAAPASCALGSIKGNLGHLDAAAGIAGFIKTVLALEYREIPPTLHFERPNPALELAPPGLPRVQGRKKAPGIVGSRPPAGPRPGEDEAPAPMSKKPVFRPKSRFFDSNN